MSSNKKHDEIVNKIHHNPGIIGLSGIVLSAREPNLLRYDNNIYHQPDNLCFDPETRKLYNIEYKVAKGREKAYTQLTQSEEWLSRLFPEYQVINLYVYSNYNVEEINKRKK